MSPPPARQGGLPDQIGRYQISVVVGVGAFAFVARAHDEALDDLVAVKVLTDQYTHDAEIRRRFVQEARLLRRVRSGNVVTVHDIGELEDGRPYFVMDYASAGTLADRLDPGGTVDPESVGRVIDALASGLTALHDAGIVHRDIKPANLLIAGSGTEAPDATRLHRSILEADEHLMIGDLGLAKDQDKTAAGPTILGGTPHFRAPEQVRPGGMITPATDVFTATGVLWSVLTGEHPPDPGSLATQLASIPAAWRPVIQQGLHPEAEQRFASARAWGEAARAALDENTGGPAGVGFRAAAPGSICPYKGLAAFQPEDAALFFGRTGLVDELVSRLQASPILVIGGPSGSGKSSLLRAGLIAALQGGAIPGSQHWPVALFTPGSDALDELAHQLSRLGDQPGASRSAADLREDPRSARHLLPDDKPTILAIDQFEELFTLNPTRGDQEAFLAALASLTESTHSRVRVVLALRADFYGACALHPWLADRINENQVLVGPMRRAELREAIEGPALRSDLRLEDGLVDTILDDAGTEAGSLPLVAHALMETWLRRRGNLLTNEGYAAAGGVAGAIAQSAEDTCSRLDDDDREAVRALFLRLTNPGEGTPDTRRRLRWDDLGDDARLREVIATLADARLLTVDATTVEIAHETLLQSWPRLRGWIDEARDDLATRQRITRAAAEWEAHDRDPDLLYRGHPLNTALAWADEHADQLGTLDATFLHDARQVQEATEAVAAEDERRRRRFRRAAVTALAALTIAAVVASVVALVALRRSQADEEEARAATAVADERFARALATSASAIAAEDPIFATALAAESAARSSPPTIESRDALANSRSALAVNSEAIVPLGAPALVAEGLTVTIAPSGDRFLTGDRDGRVTVWDTRTREELFSSDAHERGIQEAVIDPAGQLAATAGDRGQIFLWDLSAADPGEPRPLVDLGDTTVWSVALSPDARLLASAAEDGTVRLFDTSTGEQLGEPVGERIGDFLSVTFSPDGAQLFAGNGAGEIWRWDVATREPLGEPFAAHGDGDVWELVVSPDGTMLASVGADGAVELRDLATEALTLPLEVDAQLAAVGRVEGVNFDHDGDLIVGGADGRLYRYDIAAEETVEVTAVGHDGPIVDAAVAPDGPFAVSLSRDQTVRVWSLARPASPVGGIVTTGDSELFGLAVSPDGSLIATGAADGSVEVTDARTGQRVASLSGHSGPVFGLAFVDDQRLVVGDADGTLRLWEVTTGSLVTESAAAAELISDGTAIMDIGIQPDGGSLVTAHDNGSVLVWNSEIGNPREIGRHDDRATRASFSGDSDMVLSAGRDNQVRFWRVGGGEAAEPLVLGDAPAGFALGPDDRLLAIALPEAVVMFDLDADREPGEPLAPPGGVTTDVVFVDAQTVAGGTSDGAVVLWDRATGTRLGPIFSYHDGQVRRLATADDVVWSAGRDGTTRLLDVLDQQEACTAGDSSFDARLREEYLGGAALVSCQL